MIHYFAKPLQLTSILLIAHIYVETTAPHQFKQKKYKKIKQTYKNINQKKTNLPELLLHIYYRYFA